MSIHIKSYGIIPIQKRLGKILVLLVKHVNGHYWGFPKGKAHEGELPHETAVRELMEETGVEVREMISGRLFHEVYDFEKKGVLYHKEVVYFPAVTLGEASLSHPEEVEGIKWSSLDELESDLTYGPSRHIAQEFKAWIKEFDLS